MQLSSLDHYKSLCLGILVISLVLTACAGQAYRVNARRPQGDPHKRDFHGAAVFSVFFTWPVLIPLLLSLYVLRALFYGLVMITFLVLLIAAPRERAEPTWLERRMNRVGEILLEVNSALLRLLRPWARRPEGL